MSPLSRPLLMISTVLALGGCPAGFRLERVEGEKPTIDPETWNVIHAAATTGTCGETACDAALRPLIHCALPEYTALCRAEPGGAAPLAAAQEGRLSSILSFVHLSDAQLKEHRIHMVGDLSETQYDALSGGANRDEALERNDDAVLLATVLAANRLGEPDAGLTQAFAPLPAPGRPAFAVHTGDAVDSGMFSELMQFIAVMDELKMPYYNLIGNHDNLFFGNFPPEQMSGLNIVVPYVPIVDTDRFMRFHSRLGVSSDPSLPAPAHRGQDQSWTKEGCQAWNTAACGRGTLTPSAYHGFDLACQPKSEHTPALCVEARGYYAFTVALAPRAERARKVRAIVLNTAEVTPTTVGEGLLRRAEGNMLPEQLRWLRRELSRTTSDADTYFLVFGHHNLDSFLDKEQGAALTSLLSENPRVLGYFTGHTHVDAFVKHPRLRGVPLWEMVAGSTLVYPQLARTVDVLEDPAGRLFVRVATFRQRVGEAVGTLDAATLPETCSDRGEGSLPCLQLARRAAMGRQGAARDTTDADRRDEAVAVRQGNGLMLVYDPGR